MPIRRLPEDVTHRIAAGEVIERPASVVKELLENAIDAGASRATVRIAQGGILSIVVEDDGSGIPAEELPLAVERFATSKLFGIDDLERIHTLGFRGEALASIASVSRFEIRSRQEGTPTGAFIRIEGGRPLAEGPIEAAQGTRVQVDDLFFNLPARRKFLKGSSAEQRRILKVIQETAVVYPQTALLLVADGKTLFRWEGGSRREILEMVLGASGLKETRFEKGMVLAEAWRGQPRPGKRTDLLSFVNGRRVTEPTIRSALLALGPETAGDWVILVECPAGEVDVNIHPAKAEVRFRNSGNIFEAVNGAARAVIASGTELPIMGTPAAAAPPFANRQADFAPWLRVAAPREEYPSSCHPLSKTGTEPAPEGPEVSFLGTFSEGFLVYSQGDDLVLMDPHAAHERILFDRLREGMKGPIPSQRLGIAATLSPSLSAGVEEHARELGKLGFVFSGQEDGSLLLLAIPNLKGLESVPPEDLLRGTLAALDENSPEPMPDRLANRLAYAACHGAVKLGQRLDRGEALALWEQLSLARVPQACPHGRPTLLRLSGSALKRHFGRSG
jgi:DNA mismatch repair protein MutL